MEKLSNKILVLGVDGMDPRLTKKYLNLGKMPNVLELIKRGAAREDLVLLGAQPTITPPMWTTLSTGAYPMTHGITDFWLPTEDILTHFKYSMNSHNCKAEPLWNVFAENGQKTLVWHWPGNSWPPTSDSENLLVVDGLQPTSINTVICRVDWESVVWAQKNIDLNETEAFEVQRGESGAGCVIDDLEVESSDDQSGGHSQEGMDMFNDSFGGTCDTLLMDHNEGEGVIAFTKHKYGNPTAYTFVNIKPAVGWAKAPDNALEFSIAVNNGLERRPCLFVPDEKGEYTAVWIYQSKKEEKPLVILDEADKMVSDVLETVMVNGVPTTCSRQYLMYDAAKDGSSVKVYLSAAMDVTKPDVFHPHSFYQEIRENIGEVPYAPIMIGSGPEAFQHAIFPSWDHYIDWQAGCLHYAIEKKDVEIIFSHLHNVDYCGHSIWYDCVKRVGVDSDPEEMQALMQTVYEQTDKYVGKFLHLLDEGWTIFLVSDHGLLTSYEEDAPSIGDAFGTNIGVMKDLGYTVLKKDADGNDLREIDWSKTKAVAARGIYIYINLIGRNSTGIVAPEDKYELERKIIDDLYNYRDPATGKRIINLAMRNKEAVLLGVGGKDCGDIIYFCEEGFNRNHGDAISTTLGCIDTSVSPLFIAAGKGIKENFTTTRVIRQVDVAPTVATVGGVRMPNECEGAPVYQIINYNE